jgi:hypothetical protein
VRLALQEHNEGDYSSFVGYATDVDGRKYKVTYEPVDPAARPARQSTTWYDDDEDDADAELGAGAGELDDVAEEEGAAGAA